MRKILIVAQRTADAANWSSALDGAYAVEVRTRLDEALTFCHESEPHALLIDVDGFGPKGLDFLKRLKAECQKLIVLVVAEKASLAQAMASVGEGTFSHMAKTEDRAAVLEALAQAFEAQEMLQSLAYLAPKLEDREDNPLSSRSGEMNEIYRLVGKVATVNTPVLLRGESGTGKEVMAQAIHFNSPRKNGKFVAINCSAIPENLIESELFGHEKGAFTGAVARKMGKFQYAHGGTIFLDEIGDISPAMQVKLLRVLQEKKFIPVGANAEVVSDARVIAATNRDLEAMMRGGTFRDDLFYRLSVLPIFLPPLRGRREDLDSLIAHYVRKFNETHQKTIHGIDKDATAILREYAWPGNIRELRNVIEHAFILETSPVITPRSLPQKLVVSAGQPEIAPVAAAVPEAAASLSDAELDFKLEKERFERDFIVRALRRYKGRINQTSLKTHIPKKTLLRKIEKYGIKAADYRE